MIWFDCGSRGQAFGRVYAGRRMAEKYGKPVVRIFTAPATNERLMQEYIQAGGALGIFRHKWIGRLWTKDIVKATGITMKTDCWLEEIVQNPPGLKLAYTLETYQPYVEEFPKEQCKFLGASVYEWEEAVNLGWMGLGIRLCKSML